MSSSLRWREAALAGVAASMRTSAGPAVLAIRGRISGKRRIAVLAMAAGEFAVDKTPGAADRTDPPAVAGRVTAGAYTGQQIAGAPGAVAAAAGAAAGTFATACTQVVVDTTGLPDPVVASGEDLLALGAAAVATRPDPQPGDQPPRARRSLMRDAATGLVAGIAGTAAMMVALGAGFGLTDAKPSTSPAAVTEKLARAAGVGKLNRGRRRVANHVVHWLYGTSWGIPYGILARRTDVPPEISGPVFGLVVWGAAVAHQPALGIAEVPWKRSPQSLAGEALFHLVYGIGAGAAVRALGR
jgi:hypothetical protein